MINMETDLNKIKKLSKKKEDENWDFRSFLKGCNIPSEEIDVIENYSICPIVFNVYEYLKDEIWYNNNLNNFIDFD